MRIFLSCLAFSLLLAASAFGQASALKVDDATHTLKPPNDGLTFFSANAQAMVAASEAARLYPVFVLPLGGGFCDFELKASVDNFTGQDLVYFFASAVDVHPELSVWDASPKIFFTLSAPDPRVWHTANPAASLYAQIGTPTARLNQVVVIPSKITSSPSWMYKGNTHLVWSYVRINTVGPETDTAGNRVWNPIVPVDWRVAPITP